MSRSVPSVLFRSFVLLAAGLAGCGTAVEYTPLNPAAATAARRPSEVEVFVHRLPERPFVEVALLEARQESALSVDGQDEVIAELREVAAERGCDGLVLAGSADQVVGQANEGSGYVTTLKGYRATCIRWDDGLGTVDYGATSMR